MSMPNQQEGFRLSPQQAHLWMLSDGGANAPYIARCIAMIEGRLDQKKLESAVNTIVGRHEILRTSFVKMSAVDLPIQVVNPPVPVTFAECDLSELDESRQTETLDACVEEMARAVSEQLCLRLGLFSLAPVKHALAVVLPALCIDGKGLENLLAEISDSYEEAAARSRFEEPLQYADLSEWQNEMLEAPETKSGREYWRNQNLTALISEQSDLNLYTGSEQGDGFNPRSLRLEFDIDIAAGVSQATNGETGELAAYLMACWNVLLWRLTGEKQQVVGVLCEGRDNYELHHVTGLLARYLPVKANLRPDQSFTQARQSISNAVREASQYCEYFSWSEVSPAGSGYFDFCFDFEEEPRPIVSGDLSFSIAWRRVRVSQFKLKLKCVKQVGDSLLVELYYDASLFREEDARRFAEGFKVLLVDSLARPECEIDKLAVLGSFERAQVVHYFNETSVTYSDQRCVHERFADQARLTPGDIAVVFGTESLTFLELDQKSDEIARRLISFGTRPDTPVGLCVERSLEMVAGMLGILKASCAYIPLEPEYPSERLKYVLDDARIDVVLTQRKLADHLPDTRARCVFLDEPDEDIADLAAVKLPPVSTPDQLAYVLYTSGSTGQPKGVMISHRALSNHMSWFIEAYALTNRDRVFGKTPFSFDASVWEFYATLLVGGVLVLAEPGGHRWPDYLVETIANERITIVQVVPTLLRELLKQERPHRLRSLRLVFCGGEALSGDLNEKFFQEMKAELTNLYGPTEACIDTVVWPARPQPASARIPIGRPISNVQAYVVDKRYDPTPIGVLGELCLGGMALGRGYLGRPELTAEKFVPNPFSQEPGARLYRTGDLARYLPDGNLEFAGRKDHLVKFHGFRIELGEIEAILRAVPAVSDAVVVVKKSVDDRERLVAYVIPERIDSDEHGISERELLELLAERLPDYAIPSTVVFLKELPLTPNGKADRLALSDPNQSGSGTTREYVAPRTQAEHALARIWSETMGIPNVGIRDNFFELGGDSILSIQIVARAQQAGLSFMPRQMFQYQTIEALAAVAGTAGLVRAEQAEVSGEVPLTPIQIEFFEQQGPQAHFNQALLVSLEPGVPPDRIRRVINRVLAHHDALRLRFRRNGHDWIQLHAPVAEVTETDSVVHVDLSVLPDAVRKRAWEEVSTQIQRSLDLTHGPMFRALLCNLGNNEQRLLMVAHHLVIDAVSWRILLEDIESGIEQDSRGTEIRFNPKTTSFKEWAMKLQSYAASSELALEEAFWKAEQELTVAEIPVDYSGGANRIEDEAEVIVELTLDETGSLLRDVPEAFRARINEALLAGLAEAWRHWTGSNGLRVRMEGHGREEQVTSRVDLTRTAGWFTTLYPLVLNCDSTVVNSLESVRRKLRSIPNGGIGYGLLKHWASLMKEPAGTRPALSLNYLGQLDQVVNEGRWLKVAAESVGPSQHPAAQRSDLLEVSALVIRGRLQMRWAYSRQVHRRETIERVAQWHLEALRRIIKESQKACHSYSGHQAA